MGLKEFELYAKTKLAEFKDGTVRADVEQMLCDSLLEFCKIQTNNEFNDVWDGMWRLVSDDPLGDTFKAIGDGTFLELLIKLIELLLPLILAIINNPTPTPIPIPPIPSEFREAVIKAS